MSITPALNSNLVLNKCFKQLNFLHTIPFTELLVRRSAIEFKDTTLLRFRVQEKTFLFVVPPCTYSLHAFGFVDEVKVKVIPGLFWMRVALLDSKKGEEFTSVWTTREKELVLPAPEVALVVGANKNIFLYNFDKVLLQEGKET